MSRALDFFASLARAWTDCAPTVIFAMGDPFSEHKDGYIQRVKAIDGVLSAGLRIYVRFAEARRAAPFVRQSEGIYAIEMADCDPIFTAVLESIVANGANIYLHSIYCAREETVRRLIRERLGLCVLDVHGAVPEEETLNANEALAREMNSLEREIYAAADIILCVTQYMVDHLAAKHGVARNPPIVFPIFHRSECPNLERRNYHERPRVVYAGGTSLWQQIDKMLDLIAATKDRYDFTIFATPNVSEITRGLVERSVDPLAAGIDLRTVSHAEVLATYEQSDFGFVLRDDSIINRVACPTKLVEYLAYGVIPIMDSIYVGDFVDFGMKFVRLHEFAVGKVPSISERREMARQNWVARNYLADQSVAAQRSLKRFFHHDRPDDD